MCDIQMCRILHTSVYIVFTQMYVCDDVLIYCFRYIFCPVRLTAEDGKDDDCEHIDDVSA